MPDKVIQIDGVGTVAFPDSMSDDDIAGVIQKQHPELHQEKAQSFGDQLSSAAANFWQQVNPANLVRGAAQLTSHPIDAANSYGARNAELFEKAKQAYKQGDYSGAVSHGLHYLLNGVPGLGSTLDEASEQARQGDIGGALGKTAGLATSLIAGPKAPGAAASLAEGIPEAAANAATFGKAAANTGGKDLAVGAAKTAAGVATAKTGNIAAEIGLGYPLVRSGMKQIAGGAKAGIAAGREAVAARLEQLKQDAAAAVAERDAAPPMAGPVPMPGPRPEDFQWPGQMAEADLPTGAPAMMRNRPSQTISSGLSPITPEPKAAIAAQQLADALGDQPQKPLSEVVNTPDFEQLGRTKKAKALAQVLNHSEISADDLAQLPLKEQTKHLGDMAKALRLNKNGEISPASIGETIFELRKLQKSGGATMSAVPNSSETIAPEKLAPEKLSPVHRVTDQAKLQSLAESMKAHGWQGTRLLGVDVEGRIQALNGSHRIAAARQTGTQIPVEVLRDPAAVKAVTEGNGWSDIEKRPTDPEMIVQDLRDAGYKRQAALLELDEPLTTEARAKALAEYAGK